VDIPVLAQVALLVVAVAAAVPVVAIVAMTVLIPFMSDGRRREAHRCVNKLIRFAKRDGATLTSVLRSCIERRTGDPP